MKLKYRDEGHRAAFHRFLEEADVKMDDVWRLEEAKRRQIAFLYLLALYQEDYETYEGERFYVENLVEMSLGGPTYLFDEQIGKMNEPHEQMILCAKAFFRQEDHFEVIPEDQKWFEEARKILEVASE